MTDRILLHITTPTAWDEARHAGDYRTESLGGEGFIHLSTPDQVLVPANTFYGGRRDLILLLIDADRLTEPVVFEDSYRSGTEFPHLYGPLNLDAVAQVIDFPLSEDGRFRLPPAVDALLDQERKSL